MLWFYTNFVQKNQCWLSLAPLKWLILFVRQRHCTPVCFRKKRKKKIWMENKVMEKVIWLWWWAVTGVATPRGDGGLWRDGLVQKLPLPDRNTPLPAWENPRQAKSWERLHKESGHLSKEWAALSGERDVRSDTRQGLPRQGAIEWFPLKSQALCFSGEVDNAQTITVPSVSYVLTLAPAPWYRREGGGNSFHLCRPGESYLKWRKVAELSGALSEHPRSV